MSFTGILAQIIRTLPDDCRRRRRIRGSKRHQWQRPIDAAQVLRDHIAVTSRGPGKIGTVFVATLFLFGRFRHVGPRAAWRDRSGTTSSRKNETQLRERQSYPRMRPCPCLKTARPSSVKPASGVQLVAVLPAMWAFGRCLSAFEVGRPFLQKRRHAFLEIARDEQLLLHVGLAGECLFERAGCGRSHGAL